MKPKALTILISVLFCISASAMTAEQDSINRQIFDKVAQAVADSIRALSSSTSTNGTSTTTADSPANPFKTVSTAQLFGIIAQQFTGTPYGYVEFETDPEELVVRLDLTNCILFAEMCASFAITLQSDHPDYETLVDNIRRMRYRGGIVDGFASRVHYTSEWIAQNERRGILSEYTRMYGTPYVQKFSYMSRHPEQYPQLNGNPTAMKGIKEAESRLQAGKYYRIDNERLAEITSSIKEGDIIFFVSKAEGLDISHVAIAHRMNGELHFIHASSKHQKVVNESRTLLEYPHTAVRLARMKE